MMMNTLNAAQRNAYVTLMHHCPFSTHRYRNGSAFRAFH